MVENEVMDPPSVGAPGQVKVRSAAPGLRQGSSPNRFGGHIGTEHLLLGLLGEPASPARQVGAEAGVGGRAVPPGSVTHG